MTGIKILLATVPLLTIATTSALAQEPAAFQAQFPNRDVLNGGALTPAGRMGLQLPGGAAPLHNPYARMDNANPSSEADLNRSYDTATDTFRNRKHRHHSSRRLRGAS